jgi:hypothetical protein
MAILRHSRLGGTVKVRHATPARNLNSILRRGLLVAKSAGRLAAVWVCSPSKTLWAAAHVVRRHGGRIESTVVLECEVPRSWLRRSRKCLWFSIRDIPADRIRKVLSFGELAGASAA